MKDPLLPRRKGPKLKLLVSFNGTFCCRPPSRKFRYAGGETRLISVERNITYSKLKSKITDLVRQNGGVSEFSLRYHVSESFSAGDGEVEETPAMLLILLESDDDVRCMVEEYETMEMKGKFMTRLWIFVCNNGNIDNSSFVGIVDKHVLKMAGDDGFYEGKKGFVEKVLEDEGILGEDLLALLGRTDNRYGKKVSDNSSLRKMVLRQQLLLKKLDELTSFRGAAEMELTSENGDCEGPSEESCPEPESSSIFRSKIVNTGSDLCRKTTDYKYVNARRMANQNFRKTLPVTESNCGPLNSNDGNLRVGSDGFKEHFSGKSHIISGNGYGCSLESPCQSVVAGQPANLLLSSGVSSMMSSLGANYDLRNVDRTTLREMNRENIMPWPGNVHMLVNKFFPFSSHDQLIGSMFPLRSSQGCRTGQQGYQGGVRNHRFSLSDTRSQRISPYHVRSRSLGPDMGINRNFALEGRPWLGKFYPRLRSCTNISKPGPILRSFCDASLKPFSVSRYHKGEKMDGTEDFGLNNHNKLFRLPYCGLENLVKEVSHGVIEHERPGEDNRASGGTCAGKDDGFALPIDVAASSSPCAGPDSENLNTACQALSAKVIDKGRMTGKTPFDTTQGPHSSDQGEVIDCDSPHNLNYSSGTELSCSSKLQDTESGCESNIYQSSAHSLDGHTACSVDLSLHNLSLASFRKLQLPASPCARVNNSRCLLKKPSKDLDLMEEEHLNSGPKVENSSDVASNSSSDKAAKDYYEKQEIQQAPEEQDVNNKKNTCLKVDGGIPADISTFYAHLATKELQNIKNSDLEYIKELGSGMFATVYYGKWKGSDVAIKRIKSSCFTDGVKEEDRLVADFWKEAHILGHLHHPNIVALYGIVTDGPANSLAIVTEYMVNCSLKQVLRKKDRTIDRRKRLIIAMDAAFGMEYLHEKKIVHFDLKSHNFLMNMRDPQRPICKIGDLGLSKIKQRTLVSGGVRGTIPWMAPELLNGKNLVSEKVDVYSFAIVMWELLTGEEPYADMRSKEIIAGIIRGKLRPEIPCWCDPAWKSLMERCWSSDPDSRPSFSEIVKELRAMAAAMNIK